MIVKVEIYRDEDFWCARGLDEAVFTQAETLDELVKNIKEAVSLHLEGRIAKGEKVEILLLSSLSLEHVR
ncbi:MAG: type II toxin-antitoxin system HicB family antitoxin [candidate division WOR-3 bacterium]